MGKKGPTVQKEGSFLSFPIQSSLLLLFSYFFPSYPFFLFFFSFQPCYYTMTDKQLVCEQRQTATLNGFPFRLDGDRQKAFFLGCQPNWGVNAGECVVHGQASEAPAEQVDMPARAPLPEEVKGKTKANEMVDDKD